MCGLVRKTEFELRICFVEALIPMYVFTSVIYHHMVLNKALITHRS